MSETRTLSIKIVQAKSISEFKRENGNRIVGLLYFELLPEGGTVSRSITNETNSSRLLSKINEGAIYLPTEMIINELW